MQASLGATAKLAHDQRFLIVHAPLGCIGALRGLFVPTDIFVGANYIERLAQRIVDYLGMAFCAPAAPQ